MNSELKKIHDEMLSEEQWRIHLEYRREAESLLEEALEFFKTNINEKIFSTKLPVRNDEFKFMLEMMAKEERYQFDVEFSTIWFWKVFIHVEKWGFCKSNSLYPY